MTGRRSSARITRRSALLASAAAGLALGLTVGAGRVRAQAPAPGSSAALGSDRFLALAYSFAALQLRASELAASRDTRPEVRDFARKMVEFRRDQTARLLAAARANALPVPAAPEFEHRIILENLEPLDYLALSRRYVEIEVQALEQEAHGYAAADNATDEWVRTLVRDTAPQLRRFLDEARQVRQQVGP